MSESFRIYLPFGRFSAEWWWWKSLQNPPLLGQANDATNEVEMIITPANVLGANACIGKIYYDVLDPELVQNAQFILNLALGYQLNVPLNFSYLVDGVVGQTQNKDQYALYFGLYIEGTTTPVLNIPIVDVKYVNSVNYVSFLSGVRVLTMENTDINYATNCMAPDVEFVDSSQYIPNPYLPGNKSPACFPPFTAFRGYPTSQPLQTDIWNVGLPNPINPTTGQVYVFRLDKQNSQTRFAGEEPNKGCLTTYLFSTFLTDVANCGTIDESFLQYGVMRIKVPHTYDSTMPCGPMDAYDTLYYSVSAHQCINTPGDKLPEFWTVNARMMKNTPNPDGYVYVFWAPVDVAMQVKRSQAPGPNNNYWEPPIVSWGNRTGYLLGLASLAFFFRYKAPDPAWQGWPGNAPCYDTPAQNLPITDQLGDWCPQLYGQTFASYQDFLDAPSIGIVPRDGPWPSSSS